MIRLSRDINRDYPSWEEKVKVFTMNMIKDDEDKPERGKFFSTILLTLVKISANRINFSSLVLIIMIDQMIESIKLTVIKLMMISSL